MKRLLFLLYVFLASVAGADDCAVNRLVIKAQTLPAACSLTGKMRFRAVPVNASGRAVNTRTCATPQVSWGHSFTFAGLSPDGWYLWVEDLFPGDEVEVEAHLWVDDELFSNYRTFTFRRPTVR